MMWPEPKITSVHAPASMQDRFAQATRERDFAEHAQKLQKSYGGLMEQVLLHTLGNHNSLQVMRPLKYQTSELESTEDDGFYYVRKSQDSVKYVDVQRELPVGTTLLLKSLDHTMQEFIFVDQNNQEIAIPYTAKNELCTNTQVYELTQALIQRGA